MDDKNNKRVAQHRFKLEKSKEKEGWYVLTDTETLVVIKFKKHEFNETQNITHLDNDQEVIRKLGPQGIARVLREMGDYMFTHWYSIAMPTPVFEFREDDENGRTLLLRNKFPKLTIEINDDCDLKQLSDALKAAGEFVAKYKERYGGGY